MAKKLGQISLVLLLLGLLPAQIKAAELETLSNRLARGAASLKNKKIAVLAFPYHDGKISSGSSLISERLTTLQIPEFWTTHNQSYVNTNYESVGFGVPLKSQAFGFAAQYLDRGSEERMGIDTTNQPITGLGNFRYSTTLLDAGYAKSFGGKFAIGLAGKGWQDQLAGAMSKGWAADLGVQAHSLLPSLDVGAAYRNMGPKVQGYALPKSFAVGAAYHNYLTHVIQKTVFVGSTL